MRTTLRSATLVMLGFGLLGPEPSAIAGGHFHRRTQGQSFAASSFAIAPVTSQAVTFTVPQAMTFSAPQAMTFTVPQAMTFSAPQAMTFSAPQAFTAQSTGTCNQTLGTQAATQGVTTQGFSDVMSAIDLIRQIFGRVGAGGSGGGGDRGASGGGGLPDRIDVYVHFVDEPGSSNIRDNRGLLENDFRNNPRFRGQAQALNAPSAQALNAPSFEDRLTRIEQLLEQRLPAPAPQTPTPSAP